jgi:hypothetical protein
MLKIESPRGEKVSGDVADLKDLLVDEQEFDQAEMAEGLMKYVRIGSAGQLRPGESWGELSERSKVLAVVLAFKAAATLGLRTNETASAAEIVQASGTAAGTVYPALRELVDLHFLVQPARGMYAVQGMRVSQALRLLTIRRESNGK